jgi:hypothetical protein
MKQIYTFLSAILLTTIAFGQPTLTYDSHALKDGIHNPMTLCEYIDPGNAGTDVVWDFSKLVAKQQFTGHINNALSKPIFSDATTELEEFGTSFFFKIDDESVLQVGYASNNGKSIVQYDEPFEKMRFPFAFSDHYSKNFAGSYKVNGTRVGEINGNGSIEADAWGKLILPNNSVYENTLRVKTTKSYKTEFSNSEQNVEIVTYRWYNSINRYPLLVLTEYKTISNSNENISYQAAYNNNAVHALAVSSNSINEHVDVYPNPVKDFIKVKIYAEKASQAQLSIFDITGKKIFVNVDYNLSQGDNEITLYNEVTSLRSGTYLLNISMGNQSIVREISVMH